MSCVKFAQGQVIYDKSYWTSTADFTASGSPGLSVSNGKLVTTAANAGTFANYFSLTNILSSVGANISSNNDDEIDVEMTLTGSATSGYGIGVGKVTTNPAYNRWGAAAFFSPSSPNSASIYTVTAGGSVTQLGTGTVGQFTAASTDTVKVVYSQRGARFAGYIFDVTQGKMVSNVQDPGLATCNTSFPNSDNIGIFNNGGTYTIQSIRVISRKQANPAIALVGDSKTWGCNAVTREQRFGSMLSSLGPVAVYAGSGDTTQSVLNDLPYIVAMKPKSVLLNIGRNDLANSVATATWQANYSSIVSQLKAAGIKVTHLLPIPETTQADQSALKTYITTTFAGDGMIDPSAGWSNSTMLSSADGTHPSQIGHAYIASLILASGYFPATVPAVVPAPPTSAQVYGASATDLIGPLVQSLFTPASSSAACSVGQSWDDASYHYVCTAANTIKRIALTTF